MNAATQRESVRPAPSPAEVMTSSPKIIGMLSVVSLVCGLLIVSVAQITAEPISRNLSVIMRDAVMELLPGTEQQVIYSVGKDGELTVTESTEGTQPKFFAAYDGQGALLGVVIEGDGLGYGGPIKALFAYAPDRQAIVGMKILDLKETPGLGDKVVTDEAFQENFTELDASLANPIVTVRHGKKSNPWEIDAVSGATVSSKAIGRMANQSAQTLVPVITRNLERIKGGK